MLIAVLSDSHDQIANLKKALAAANAAGATALLHCGDLCAPFMLDRLGRHFRGAVHVVAGNNDGDGRLLQTIAANYEHVTLHGIYTELAFDGHTCAMIHYPEPARRIAQSGQFRLVCYGHDHTKHIETINPPSGSTGVATLLVNPGELLGMKGAPTWGLYDTDSGKFTLHQLDE